MQRSACSKTLVAESVAIIFLLLIPYAGRMGLTFTGAYRGPPVQVGPANGFGTPTGLSAPSNLMITASIGLFYNTPSDTLPRPLPRLHCPNPSLYTPLLPPSPF